MFLFIIKPERYLYRRIIHGFNDKFDALIKTLIKTSIQKVDRKRYSEKEVVKH